MMQHFYTVWPASAEHLSVQRTCPCTTKCQSPHQAAASRTDRQWVCVVVADVDKHQKKKNRLFYVRFKLVKSASQIQFSKTHFLRPGSLTTAANLRQTCPNQHFPIPDQSQLTDLQTRLDTVYKKNSSRCNKNNDQSMFGIYTVNAAVLLTLPVAVLRCSRSSVVIFAAYNILVPTSLSPYKNCTTQSIHT